jgi:hypothetical protein
MKRWPELRVVKPRSLEVSRAKSTSDATVQNYFNQLEHIIDKYELQNSRFRFTSCDTLRIEISSRNNMGRCVVGRNALFVDIEN